MINKIDRIKQYLQKEQENQQNKDSINKKQLKEYIKQQIEQKQQQNFQFELYIKPKQLFNSQEHLQLYYFQQQQNRNKLKSELQQNLLKPLRKNQSITTESHQKIIQDYKTQRENPQQARLQFQIKRTKIYNNPIENLGITYPIYFEQNSMVKLDKQIQFSIKISAFKDFLTSIAFHNNIFVEAPIDKSYPLYKAFVGKGNNAQLIRMTFKKRPWWTLTDSKEDPNINIFWTQIRNQKFLEGLKLSSKDEEKNINNKLFSSERNYQSQKEENQEKVQQEIDKEGQSKDEQIQKYNQKQENLSKLFNSQNFQLLNGLFINRKRKKFDSQALTLQVIQSFLTQKKDSLKINKEPHLTKMHNHLEDNFHLTNKKALFYNMRAYYQSMGKDVFQYLPLTFHIQEGKEDYEYIKFQEYFQEQQTQNKPNIWIIKPGENTNRGSGIKVLNEISQIQQIIDSKEVHTQIGIRKTYIIQKYIEQPLLYQKRKFDIRCYYLLTTFNGRFKAYWYQEGYVRTSSQEFTVKNFNKNIHLTNDAVQNKDETYGKYEIGNKVSYQDMNKYIQQNYPNKDLYINILPQIKNIAKDTIKAVYGKIDPYRKENTLEIYGLDFMVDQQFNVWLIEINTNPALDICSPLLSKIIPEMIENTFRIAIDPVYPPANITNIKYNFNIDNPLENNKYELIFDEFEDGNSLQFIENDKHLNWENINKEDEESIDE